MVSLPILQPSVFDTTMPTLSPSQMETAECTMQWYYHYVEKIPKAEKRAASDGSTIDKLVEGAIKTGQLPSSDGFGVVALVALDYLARPGAQAQVVVTGVPFGGALFGGWTEGRPSAIDVLDEVRIKDPTEVDERGNPIPHVMDLKTTGKRKWIKTREMLEKDLQALIYARAASLRFEARFGYLPPHVDMTWLYVIRDIKKPATFPVEFFLTQKMIAEQEEAWQPAIARALDMAVRAAKGQFQKTDARKNLLCCGKYGGCSYGPRFRGNCELTAEEQYMTSMSEAQLAQILTQNGVSMPPTGPEAQPMQGQPQQGGLPQPMQQELPSPQMQLAQPSPVAQQQPQPSPEQFAAWQAQQAQQAQYAAWQAQQAQQPVAQPAQQPYQPPAAQQWQGHMAQGQYAQQQPAQSAQQPYQAPTSAGFQQSVMPQPQMMTQPSPAPGVPPGVDPASYAAWQRQNNLAASTQPMQGNVVQMHPGQLPAAQPAPGKKKLGRPTKEEAAAKKAARAAAAIVTGQAPPDDDDELADVLDALADVLAALATRMRG